MKTSIKILIGIAVFVIGLLIYLASTLHSIINTKQLIAESKYKYKSQTVESFDKIDLSSHWSVRIRQGKECKVEVSSTNNASLKPMVENINGTLYLKCDTSVVQHDSIRILVRISMPQLQEIKAMRGSQISMFDFTSDSIIFILNDRCEFKGKNCTFKKVSYITNGEVSLNITNDL